MKMIPEMLESRGGSKRRSKKWASNIDLISS